VRRIYSAWGNDPRGDFIPAIGHSPVEHPDQMAMREPPPSIQPPRGHPTFNFDRETETLICKFNQYEIEPSDIQRALHNTRKEYGVDSVKYIEVQVCAEVMAGPSGIWLVQMDFERRPDTSARTAMYRWVKKAKPAKKMEGK
jgi:hypothetical protein